MDPESSSWLGSGHLGVAFMFRILSFDHLNASGMRFTVRTLVALPLVSETTMCSPVLSTIPTHMPVIILLIIFLLAVVFFDLFVRSIRCLATLP